MDPMAVLPDALELRQFKNNSSFEITALFHHLHDEGKSAPILKLECFWTEWSHSYIVLALTKGRQFKATKSRNSTDLINDHHNASINNAPHLLF